MLAKKRIRGGVSAPTSATLTAVSIVSRAGVPQATLEYVQRD